MTGEQTCAQAWPAGVNYNRYINNAVKITVMIQPDGGPKAHVATIVPISWTLYFCK